MAKWRDQLMPVDEIKQLTDAVLRFRDARDWKRPINGPTNLPISFVVGGKCGNV